MILSDRQLQLFEYVKEGHGDQVRKYTNAPYWTHLLSVAEIVSRYDQTPGLIEIALCHDLLEDTDCEPSALYSQLCALGYDKPLAKFIFTGIEALTDQFVSEAYPDMNRKARKIAECERLGKIDPHYQTVKYTDMIDNSSSIIEYDRGFARIYLKEKKRALDAMRLGNIDLLIECCYSLKSGMEKLGMR